MISAVLLIAYGVWSYFLAAADERLVLNPVLLSAALVAAMIEYFWRRDRQLPIVDVGALCALITLVYMAVPAIFYIKAGLNFTAKSDPRLMIMATTPADVADFLWFVTSYIAALCVAYTLLRGQGMPGPRAEIGANPNAGWTLVAVIALALIYQIGIEHAFNVNLNPSNKQLHANNGVLQLPLFIGQITHNILGIGQIAKLGIVAFVFARKSWLLGSVLAAWLLIEAYSTVSTMGARTYFVMLIIAALLSYHRMLKPIGPIPALAMAICLLAGLLGYGYVRQGTAAGISDIWSLTNEFQILMANGMSISWYIAGGFIHDVPWQITYNDFILMIPQQLLPIPKLDVSDWFMQQIGWSKQGNGIMFGVVAQSKLGFGLPEIIIRGAVLGAVLAFIHRQCVKHASSLASFIIYLWLCASIYYTYRASTFYIATWAIYRVIPIVLLLWLFSWMFRPRGNAETGGQNPMVRGTDMMAQTPQDIFEAVPISRFSMPDNEFDARLKTLTPAPISPLKGPFDRIWRKDF
jgi:hypothetical protein